MIFLKAIQKHTNNLIFHVLQKLTLISNVFCQATYQNYGSKKLMYEGAIPSYCPLKNKGGKDTKTQIKTCF